jgi:hypothetical protein
MSISAIAVPGGIRDGLSGMRIAPLVWVPQKKFPAKKGKYF